MDEPLRASEALKASVAEAAKADPKTPEKKLPILNAQDAWGEADWAEQEDDPVGMSEVAAGSGDPRPEASAGEQAGAGRERRRSRPNNARRGRSVAVGRAQEERGRGTLGRQQGGRVWRSMRPLLGMMVLQQGRQ